MRRSLAYVLMPSVRAALENPERLTGDQAADLGRASRALLRAAWEAEARDWRLILAAIAAVVRTFTTDPGQSEELLRRVIDPGQLQEHGHEELRALAPEVDRLFAIAPDFCAEIYEAAFSYEEPSDETTVMTSGVLPLTSNRRQDYHMAQYGLAEVYPAFLREAPEAALRALVAVRSAYAFRRSHGRLPEGDPETVDLGDGRTARFLPDASGIWDDRPFHEEAEVRMLGAFEERLEELIAKDPSQATELVRIVLRMEAPAAVWRRMFAVGGRHPETIAGILARLAAAPIVLTSSDLAEPAIAFSAAAFTHLTEDQREAMERTILSLPDSVEHEKHELEERRRDQLLGRLSEALLVTPEARERYVLLKEGSSAPEQPPPPFQDGWRESTHGEREYLVDQGVDIDSEPIRRVREAGQPVKTFAATHVNDVPTVEAAHALVPALHRLLEAVETACADTVHLDAAWGHLAQAARAISRQSNLPCDDDARQLAVRILIAASDHGEPRPHDSDAAQFDEGPSWGSPAPRVDAADGLIHLASRPECDRGDLLAAIDRLRDDPVPAVRHHLAQAIAILGNSEPDAMWTLIDALADDKSTAVREALVNSLHCLLGVDRGRSLRTITSVYDAVDDDAPGSTRLRHACLNAVADVYIWEGEEDARVVIDDLVQRLPATAEDAGSIVFRLRPVLTVGPTAEPDQRLEGGRARAVQLVERLLYGAIQSSRAAADGQPTLMDEWSAGAVTRWKQAMELIDRIGMELHVASGAYTASSVTPESRDPTDPQRRLYQEASGIIDRLVDIGVPRVTHHLLETLEHFVPVDPRGVFMRIVATIGAGRTWGYQYDNLAEGLFVRLVERYIAEYRTLLQQDRECSRAMVEILDIFVRAGWPSARRITYGLSDIYR
jgi:hypothetical protein